MAHTFQEQSQLKVERDALAQHLRDILDSMGGPDSFDAIRRARKALSVIFGEEAVDAFGAPRRMVAYDYNGRT